jgi:hypothetical protein
VGGSISVVLPVTISALTGPLDSDSDGIINDLDEDDDNDGFTDAQELTAGTNPIDPDSKTGGTGDLDGDATPDDIDTDDDNDGITDSAELADGTDPYDAASNVGPSGDIDGDAIVNSADSDDDGDGFSDQLETALGTSPLKASSNPMNSATPVVAEPLTLAKMAVKLNFRKTLSDSISASGVLAVPADFVVAGKQVAVDIGGVVKVFNLDLKGNSPKGNDSFKIKVKAKKSVVLAQSAKFQTKFNKGDFAASLVDEGMSSANTVRDTPVNVLVMIYFNGHLYATQQAQLFSASAGKSGKTKMPRK